MRNNILTFFLVLTTLGGFVGTNLQFNQVTQAQVIQSPTPKVDDCDTTPIAQIDANLQRRFAEDNTKSFGIRRILTIPAHVQQFSPETKEEWEAIESLRANRYEIYVYLAGRRILGEKPDIEKWKKANVYFNRLISDPISITRQYPEKVNTSLPKPWDLWDEARSAFKTFETRPQQQFVMEKWNFIARPVRASKESCLKCHRSDSEHTPWYKPEETTTQNAKDKAASNLKLGDPLGILLYAYVQKK